MSFTDPVVRCTECQRMIFREEIYKCGCCPDCGNRKVRNVLTMKQEEKNLLEDMGCHDFLKLFEGVE
jgi:hypothetical protein